MEASPLGFHRLEEMVNHLYSVREMYYKNFPNANAETKRCHIEGEMSKLLERIEESIDHAEGDDEKDMLVYLKAKLLNIVPKFYAVSEEILTRHVKFYPFHLEAWNILGECFWKKTDMMSSKNCFLKSLEICRNSTALRCLSMLFRSLPGTEEEVSSYMLNSLQMARDAVTIDVEDGKNWYVLGNVYIAMYFKTDQDPSWLKQSLKAYTNAARHDNIRFDPDFHFNRAVAHNYDGDYQHALQSYDAASTCDPNWGEPKKCITNLLTFLHNCQESIATRGKIKARKLRDILKSLKPCDIGMYAEGIRKKIDGKIVNIPLTACSLSSLVLGVNLKKIVLGKVVCHIYSPEAVTFAFCMLEDDGPCYAVNVYNIAEGRGVKIGDSVAIPEPVVRQVDFKFKDEEFKFQLIRVDDPLLMVVNGRPMSRDNKAVPVLKTVFNPDS